MAVFTVFGYSRCSTCRKALLWLESEGFEFEVIDITLKPPSVDHLHQAYCQFGEVKPLFNTSGQSYRAIGAEAVKKNEQRESAASTSGRRKADQTSFRSMSGWSISDWFQARGLV